MIIVRIIIFGLLKLRKNKLTFGSLNFSGPQYSELEAYNFKFMSLPIITVHFLHSNVGMVRIVEAYGAFCSYAIL